MSKIRIDLEATLINGQSLTFQSPADCSQITGLIVYYPEGNGTTSKDFQFVDAHGVDVGSGTISLFAENVLVKVVLDTDQGKAYVQNADTNAYLEGRFAQLSELKPKTGNILETLRTDLGDEWLLCNGDPVPDGEYPALRDMLHYNTEWKRLPLLYGYGTVRPMPVAGQWLVLRTQSSAFHFAYTAYLYDANTDDLKTITCPEQSGSTIYGIAGMTHDGNRYILVVSDTTNSKVIFYTTSDFVTWTQIYTKAMLSTSYHAFDVSWDGDNILWMEGYTTSGTTKYRIRCVNKALSKVTELTSAEGSTSYLPMFYLLPNGYWTRYNPNDTSVYVYPAGKSESTGNRLFYFSSGYYLARIAFFNDKYWLGIPLKGESQRSIQYVDLASKTVSTIGVERIIMGVTATSSYGYLYDVEYIRESNEWVMYVTFKKTSNDAAQFYHVYISADADPSVADNYRRVEVVALPEILPPERMAPDRSRMYYVSDTEIYLRDPNQKYLPESDGDAYKYVYKGEPDTRVLELEYIESTGSQYLDTGVVGKSGVEIYLDYEYRYIGSDYQVVIGSFNGDVRFYPVSSGGWLGYGAYNTLSDKTLAAKTPYSLYAKLYAGEQTLTMNGKTKYSATDTASYDTGRNMFLFAANKDGAAEQFSLVRIKSCKVMLNGTLVSDLVPCRTMIDGKVCMYDRVTGEYRDNLGTGKFIAGPVVGELETEETV